MKVKITIPDAWYTDKVGCIYDVYSEDDEDLGQIYLLIKEKDTYGQRFITPDNCEVVEEIEEIKRDAKRWNALINSGRIRILGTAGIGNPEYQHFGMEIWSEYGLDYKNKEEQKYGVETLEAYTDTIIKG